MRVLRSAITWALAALTLGMPALADVAGDSAATDPLAATSAAPWVPPAPVAPAEPWEVALRAPGYVLSLPLRLIGSATEAGLAHVERSDLVPRLLAPIALSKRLGLTLSAASLGDLAGFGVGVMLAPPLVGRHLVADASTTTEHYNRERIAGFLGPLRVVYVSAWRSREQFAGFGMDSDGGDRSAYAVRSQSMRVVGVYPYPSFERADLAALEGAIVDPAMPRDDPARTQMAVWAGPAVDAVTNGRDRDGPSLEEVFPDVAATSLHRRVERLVYGARLSHDARSGRPRWTRGWRASVEVERNDRSIEAIGLKDAHTDARSFTRITWHAEGGVSAGRDPRTLRLVVQVVDQRLDDGGGAFLVSDYMSLGGSRGLAGFEPGRFHDVDLALTRLSYVYPLGKNLEFDWRIEAGGVFPTLGAVRPDRLETSYGGFLRVRGDTGMIGAIGLAWSRDAAYLKFSIGSPD